MVCNFCNKDINIKTKASLTAHMARCFDYRRSIDLKLTKKYLKNEYISKGKSALEIYENTGIAVGTILSRLDKFGIKRRNISQAKKQPKCKERAEKTNLIRHGAKHNFSREHPSRIAWQKKMFNEEGIVSVFQRQEVIDKISSTMSRNPESRSAKFGCRFSKPHLKLFTYIKNDLKIENIIVEYKINIDKNTNKYYDICIPNLKLIIEVNGTIYHADPKKYLANDLLDQHPAHKKNPIFAKEIWLNDKIKTEIAEQHGFKVIYFWEKDINKNFAFVIKQINLLLGNINETDKINLCKESQKYFKEI